MAILDTYSNVTGAWSMDRVIVGSYGGALYNTVTGVSSLNDQTGNGRHFTNATAAQQPTVGTGGVNNRACAFFDGGDDTLVSTGNLSTLVANNTSYMVCVFVPQSAVDGQLNSVTDMIFGSEYMGMMLTALGGPRVYAYNHTGGSSDNTTPSNVVFSAGTGPVFVMERRQEGGNLYSRVNGGSWSTAKATGNTGNIAQPAYFGYHPGYGFRAHFRLFEHVIFNVIPSVGQQDALVADMMARYVGAAAYADKLYMTAAYANANAANYVDAISANKMHMTAAYANANAINYVDAISLNKAFLTVAYKISPFYISGTQLRTRGVAGYNYGPVPLMVRSVDAEAITVEQLMNVYVLQVGAPALHSQNAFRTSSSTIDFSVITTGSTGTIYWVATNSRVQPTAAQVVAGQNELGATAPDFGTLAVSGSGEKIDAAIVPSAQHWIHIYHVAGDGKISNIVTADTAVGVAPPAPPLDGLAPTGAWSFARKLLTSYGGSFYRNDGSGVADILYDQSGNSRNFVEGVIGPVISTLGPNSRPCGDFDAAGDYMNTVGFTLDTFVNNNSAFMVVSCVWDTITEQQTASYNNHGVLGDTSGYLGIYARAFATTPITTYVAAQNWDGSDDVAHVVAYPGVGAVFTLRLEGGNLYAGVNGIESAPVPTGNTQVLTSMLRLGRGNNISGRFMDGKVVECAVFDTVPSLAARDALIANFLNYSFPISEPGLVDRGTNLIVARGTPHTFAKRYFGPAHADRKIIVGCAYNDGTFNGTSISSMTIGGVAATEIVDAFGTNLWSGSEIWAAAVPTGISGDIVVNFTSAGATGVNISVYRTTTMSIFGVYTGEASGITCNLSIEPDGFVVGVGNNMSNVLVDFTNLNDDYQNLAGGNMAGSHASLLTTTTATLAVAYTAVGATQNAIVAAFFGPPGWKTGFSKTMTGENNGFGGYNSRQSWPVGGYGGAGATMVRITMQASSSESFQCDALWCGNLNPAAMPSWGGGTTADRVQLTVGGSPTFTIPAGTSVTTDGVAFVPNLTKPFGVAWHCSGSGSTDGVSLGTNTGGADYYKAGASEAHLTTASGYGSNANNLVLTRKIEFYNPT